MEVFCCAQYFLLLSRSLSARKLACLHSNEVPLWLSTAKKIQPCKQSEPYASRLHRGISRLCDFHLGASVLLQLHGYLTRLGGVIYRLLLSKEPPSSSWPLDLGR